MFFHIHKHNISAWLSGSMIKHTFLRINELLLKEELESIQNDDLMQGDDPDKYAINIENAYYSWQYVKEDSLPQVNLKVEKGDLLTVFGEQGSGKTTLLYSILGITQKT